MVPGVGWGGFYATGSGTRTYLSGGMAVEQPLILSATHATLRAEFLAISRDARLRLLDLPDGVPRAVVPLATLSLMAHW